MLFFSLIFLLKIFFSADGVVSVHDPPNAIISNGILKAELYLPDMEKGYYRSTRFDWSGIISKLEYNGHNYFGQWFEYYDPKKHDAICGPVDEFGAIGYENATVGNTFLKIGVGMLKKSSNEPYSPFTYYEIESPGKRCIHKMDNAIEFKHALTDTSGYAYEYTKTIKLIDGKPELVVSYCLKNTGKLKIETTVYNHNFFMIDHQKTGPDIDIRFPFKLVGDGLGIGELAQVTGRQIKFLKTLKTEDRVLIRGLNGFDDSVADHAFTIENRQTGAGVKLKGDKPLEHLVFWSCSTTYCPEPYIKIDLAPMKEISWVNTYTFYTF
jgi:hypothetical protein